MALSNMQALVKVVKVDKVETHTAQQLLEDTRQEDIRQEDIRQEDIRQEVVQQAEANNRQTKALAAHVDQLKELVSMLTHEALESRRQTLECRCKAEADMRSCCTDLDALDSPTAYCHARSGHA
ncbi:hypothetical protein GPECTOR_144g732 [Gonium pectorale]|uniref:Uncharacterized protein n=1 Tax=Gonium pectorale TaxID=33097 RepID=A0A150FXZ0_GONPE|nr:hypothetical protein GPECTOR_144g732 [Gonium pectorale]|eukprot:KXZ42469.1 hypothetical protein GPECTOR_144g732 [Gonium pectorale]